MARRLDALSSSSVQQAQAQLQAQAQTQTCEGLGALRSRVAESWSSHGTTLGIDGTLWLEQSPFVRLALAQREMVEAFDTLVIRFPAHLARHFELEADSVVGFRVALTTPESVYGTVASVRFYRSRDCTAGNRGVECYKWFVVLYRRDTAR